jgi:NADH-ubiquinone oxidoreductase chain 4L
VCDTRARRARLSHTAHFVGPTVDTLTYNLPTMLLSLTLYVIGILGLILQRKSVIHMLLCIELMLLAVTLIFLTNSFALEDLYGLTYAILILALVGAETAIGLSILVAFYRVHGSIDITKVVPRSALTSHNSPRARVPLRS